MTETASRYLDLHLDVARYFERPDVQEMTRAVRLLYNHTPQQGYLLLHMFPQKYFPFATEEEWNEFGRMVNTEAVEGKAKFLDDEGDEKVVYSVINTVGKPIPDFPGNHPPPDVDKETYHRIFNWLDDMRIKDKIKLIEVPNMHGNGGYNYKTNEIIIPDAVSKGYKLHNYMHSYLYFLKQKDFGELTKEELDDYHTVLRACTYKLFKDRGYDTGDYGLGAIATSVESFDKYLDLEEDIEILLGYFEGIE